MSGRHGGVVVSILTAMRPWFKSRLGPHVGFLQLSHFTKTWVYLGPGSECEPPPSISWDRLHQPCDPRRASAVIIFMSCCKNLIPRTWFPFPRHISKFFSKRSKRAATSWWACGFRTDWHMTAKNHADHIIIDVIHRRLAHWKVAHQGQAEAQTERSGGCCRFRPSR